MSELLYCPHCKGQAKATDMGGGYMVVTCLHCSAEASGKSAVADWQARAGIVHCENCGGSWYDDGMTDGCPLCRIAEERKLREAAEASLKATKSKAHASWKRGYDYAVAVMPKEFDKCAAALRAGKEARKADNAALTEQILAAEAQAWVLTDALKYALHDLETSDGLYACDNEEGHSLFRLRQRSIPVAMQALVSPPARSQKMLELLEALKVWADEITNNEWPVGWANTPLLRAFRAYEEEK